MAGQQSAPGVWNDFLPSPQAVCHALPWGRWLSTRVLLSRRLGWTKKRWYSQKDVDCGRASLQKFQTKWHWNRVKRFVGRFPSYMFLIYFFLSLRGEFLRAWKNNTISVPFHPSSPYIFWEDEGLWNLMSVQRLSTVIYIIITGLIMPGTAERLPFWEH